MKMKTIVELEPVSVSKMYENQLVDVTEDNAGDIIRIHSDPTNNDYCYIEIDEKYFNFEIDDVIKALTNARNTNIGE